MVMFAFFSFFSCYDGKNISMVALYYWSYLGLFGHSSLQELCDCVVEMSQSEDNTAHPSD